MSRGNPSASDIAHGVASEPGYLPLSIPPQAAVGKPKKGRISPEHALIPQAHARYVTRFPGKMTL
jgi:hypothetical protein